MSKKLLNTIIIGALIVPATLINATGLQENLMANNQSTVEITAIAEPTILDVQIPLTVQLNINPNQPYVSAFTTPTIDIINNTNAPVALSVVSMKAKSGSPIVSLQSKYSTNPDDNNSWANLSSKDSAKYISFGLKQKDGGINKWKDPSYSLSPLWLTDETSQTVEKIGDIKNKGQVQLEFMAHHGMAFNEAGTFKYDLMFKVGLSE